MNSERTGQTEQVMITRDAKLGLMIGLAILASLFIFSCQPAHAQAQSIEERVARLEAAVFKPTTRPSTPVAKIVRADSAIELKAAIAAGAQHIQTTGLEIAESIDCKGALIELLPGGPGWKPCISLSGEATLSNVAIKTPPSTFNSNGHRTGFNKAIVVTGKAVTLNNVTIAPDAGFCIHVMRGRLTMESVKATTFSEYFVFQEAATHVVARWCEVKGGSRSESVWRTSGGTYDISECLLDNSAGGKAVLRGDSPGTITHPGGIVRRTKLVGQVGPNPLTEDDGGQMLGIDRWRYAEGWIYQLDSTRKAETIAFARQLFINGATPAEIVRTCADKFIDPAQLAKVAKGKTKLSDAEIKLTLDYRASECGRSSTVLIEDCDIVGGLRLNARVSGTVRRTKVDGGTETPISGNSQTTYPFPTDRVIVANEQQPGPAITFDAVTLTGGSSLGVDLIKYPGLKFINGSSYAGKTLTRLPIIWNGTQHALAGLPLLRVDNGWFEIDGKSAWTNGGEIKGRFDVIESRLRALAAGLATPYVVDIEWQDYIGPVVTEATARRNLAQHAKILNILQGATHQPISTYSWPRTDFYPTWHKAMLDDYRAGRPTSDDEAVRRSAKEWEADWARQVVANDLMASYLADQVDFLLVNIYPVGAEGPTTLMDEASFIRTAIGESTRLAKGKRVVALYLPHASGAAVSDARARNALHVCKELGVDVILWTGNMPRADVDRLFASTIRNFNTD
jgi:hypothetical protein